jgi:hypothetical protein
MTDKTDDEIQIPRDSSITRKQVYEWHDRQPARLPSVGFDSNMFSDPSAIDDVLSRIEHFVDDSAPYYEHHRATISYLRKWNALCVDSRAAATLAIQQGNVEAAVDAVSRSCALVTAGLPLGLDFFGRAAHAIDEFLLTAAWADQRLCVLLDLIEGAAPSIFWACLDHQWRNYHLPRTLQARLLRACRRNAQQRPSLDRLPASLIVFRGCSRPRIRGLSWTRDESVAARFAFAEYGVTVPDPIIARAEISRDAVFLAIDGRNEAELLVDPRRLRKLIVQSFSGEGRS